MEESGKSNWCQTKARTVAGPTLRAAAALKPALHACGGCSMKKGFMTHLAKSIVNALLSWNKHSRQDGKQP